MPRIDSLTAQMRQRSVKRVSVRSDEKMQLFDDQGRLLGAGAVLSGEVVAGLLSQIAPSPLDGTPVSFPYSGRDGRFEVSVKDGGKEFELHALSFASNAALETHAQPQAASSTIADQTFTVPDAPPAPAPAAVAPSAAPALLAEWFYLRGAEQVGNNSPDQIRALIAGGHIAPDTPIWTAGMAGWLPASHTEFASSLPAQGAAPDKEAAPVSSGAPIISPGELTGRPPLRTMLIAGVIGFVAVAGVVMYMRGGNQNSQSTSSSANSAIPPGNGKPFGNLPGSGPSAPASP